MATSSDKLSKTNLNINKEDQFKIIIKNLLTMIYNRGLISQEDINVDKNIKNFKNTYLQINLLNKKKLFVYFYDTKISSIKKLENIDQILEDNENMYIFIIQKIQNKIWEILAENNKEVFSIDDLLISVIDHNLQPKFELLKDKELEDFKLLYKIDLPNIPKILKFDPISRYYNAKVGDIFRITRFSITSGISPTYRLVKNGPLPVDN